MPEAPECRLGRDDAGKHQQQQAAEGHQVMAEPSLQEEEQGQGQGPEDKELIHNPKDNPFAGG